MISKFKYDMLIGGVVNSEEVSLWPQNYIDQLDDEMTDII